MTTPVKHFKHPYISINKKIRDGEPIIAGTGIRVLDIAIRHELMGMSPEDIIIALPHLTFSQVHAALSYYYDYKNEMDKKWKKSIENIEKLKKGRPSIPGEKGWQD
ncbi:MAG TPA: DUF433 domain-containing protein [Candidatus Wunengus sp. YC60]|uniref:DUF433 domain-containing protein n=1 Tax=Candidatus Wunengus sp. YC60 TaxID=3367697 RepID=UPI00402778DC